MINRRKPFLSMAALTATMGVIAFSGVASNPRFESYYSVDVIRLMTAGASIAVTIVILIQYFTFAGPRPEDKKEDKRGTS